MHDSNLLVCLQVLSPQLKDGQMDQIDGPCVKQWGWGNRDTNLKTGTVPCKPGRPTTLYQVEAERWRVGGGNPAGKVH